MSFALDSYGKRAFRLTASVLAWRGRRARIILAVNRMERLMPVIENVSLEELKAGLADGTILLVDVREPNEWSAGHIEGAVLNPLSAFDPAGLPKVEAGKRVVLQCRSGKRSITALSLAQENGRDDVRAHFGGGMLEWIDAGEAVV